MTNERRLARRRVKEQKYRGFHVKLRRWLKPLVAQGDVECWRCGNVIQPDDPWDLGHDDIDPTKYAGPEHQWCNRGAPNRLVFSRQW